MKNRSVTLCLLTATLFAVPAFAEDQPAQAAPSPAVPAPGQRPSREEMIKRFDQDGDGHLSDAERQTAREKMRQKWAERGGKRGPGGAMREKMRKHFDHDGDGQLNKAERHEARKTMKKMHRKMQHRMTHRAHGGRAFRGPGGPGFGPHRPMRQALLKRFDQDADGKLGEAERGEMRKAGEARRAKAQEQRKQMLSRFDGDGDGRLGETERQAMREAWQKFIEQQPMVKK